MLDDISTLTSDDLQPVGVTTDFAPSADTTAAINDAYNLSQSSSWSGLDNLGSSITNVASNIFSAAGNLVAAQVNNQALLTATGQYAKPTTNAIAPSANTWGTVLIAGVALLAVVGVIYAVKKS